MAAPIPYETLQLWKQQVRNVDSFVDGIPKVELHVHIEGTMSPELRWKLAQRNGLPLRSERLNKSFHSSEELKEAYNLLQPRSIKGANQISAFFEAYYGGMEALRTEEDFYDLAMGYFERAAAMNVRYCEPLFDPQGHTRRRIPFETFMGGFRKAQAKADIDLNVKSQWIMCCLRDLSPAAAMKTYVDALPYKDMIVGVGLDSNEFDRPPLLFEDLFLRARADGFKLTCHCDVTQKNTHEHIRQVVESIGGTGGDRCDHGLDAASRPDLVALLIKRDVGLTLCPWAYVRHHTETDLFTYVRTLYDGGVKFSIGSDSPAYVEDNWITHNLMLLRLKGGFTDHEIAEVERNAVSICWADEKLKGVLLEEINAFAVAH